MVFRCQFGVQEAHADPSTMANRLCSHMLTQPLKGLPVNLVKEQRSAHVALGKTMEHLL